MKFIGKSYRLRFPKQAHERRAQMWQALCKLFFQKYIRQTDSVMDMGAGYCEFINAIQCRKKIAVDVNIDTKRFASRDVIVLPCGAMEIPKKYFNTIDVIVMSNFLEHLPDKRVVLSILEHSFKLLKKNGCLIIMQPNIDLVKERYWNFIDHHIALNGESLTEAISITGFTREVFIRKFLPYTTKELLPAEPWMIYLYLKIPEFFRPFAGQSLLIARKIR